MQLTEMLQALQPFAIGGVLVLIWLAEHIIPQRKDLIDHGHDLINVGFGLIAGVVILGAGYVLQQWLIFMEVHHFGLLYWLHLEGLPRYAIAFVLQDVIMYWWHRANHFVPFLWRWHRFHHIDLKMNSSTAIRFHVMELLLSYLVVRLPLFALLGISIPGMLIYGIIFFSIVIFHHSNLKLSLPLDFFIRRLIVTPHMHRIHHSVIRRERDANYSSVFSFWDKIFGSYIHKPEGSIEFGITKLPERTRSNPTGEAQN